MRTSVALTIASGGVQSNCTFAEVHAGLTHVLGRDVWTHEMAEKSLWDRAASLVLAAVPALTDHAAAQRDAVGNEVLAAAALFNCERELGSEIDVPRGDDTRTESPLASLARIAPGKPVVAITSRTWCPACLRAANEDVDARRVEDPDGEAVCIEHVTEECNEAD